MRFEQTGGFTRQLHDVLYIALPPILSFRESYSRPSTWFRMLLGNLPMRYIGTQSISSSQLLGAYHRNFCFDVISVSDLVVFQPFLTSLVSWLVSTVFCHLHCRDSLSSLHHSDTYRKVATIFRSPGVRPSRCSHLYLKRDPIEFAIIGQRCGRRYRISLKTDCFRHCFAIIRKCRSQCKCHNRS